MPATNTRSHPRYESFPVNLFLLQINVNVILPKTLQRIGQNSLELLLERGMPSTLNVIYNSTGKLTPLLSMSSKMAFKDSSMLKC